MRHAVTFTLPERDLGNADAEFKVRTNDEGLGRLKVSKGTVVWVPKNATYGYKLTWSEFDELMRGKGVHEKNGRSSAA